MSLGLIYALFLVIPQFILLIIGLIIENVKENRNNDTRKK